MKTDRATPSSKAIPAWFHGSASQWSALRSRWRSTQRLARWIAPLRETHRSMGAGSLLCAFASWLFWGDIAAISAFFAALGLFLALAFLATPWLIDRLRVHVKARERETHRFCEGLAHLGAIDGGSAPASSRRRTLEACVQDAVAKTRRRPANAPAFDQPSAKDERGRPVPVEVIAPRP